MANPPSSKSPAGSRPPQKKPAQKSAGRPAGLFTWILVGLVVVVIAAIVIVKISNGSSAFVAHPISQNMYGEITGVPMSTFNTVGVTSPAVAVSPIGQTKNTPVLKWADSNGVVRPTFYYQGAEYCPYCAAERWPMIIALSRFGTWKDLYTMISAPAPEYFPNTPTFTFLHATYTSNYINFFSTETQTRDHQQLQTPTAQQNAVVAKFDPPPSSIPFATIGNQAIIIGANPSPSALVGNSREQISSILADPTNPLAQGLIAAANYISSAICHMDGQAPASVCTSPGVKAANVKMGYKS